MLNSFLIPPKLILRALDDLNTLAEVARRVPEIEARVDDTVARIERELVQMRTTMTTLDGRMEQLVEEAKPIAEISAVRVAAEPLADKLEDVKAATDHLEPLLRDVEKAVRGLDPKLQDIRDAIEPVGEVADNLPAFMKR